MTSPEAIFLFSFLSSLLRMGHALPFLCNDNPKLLNEHSSPFPSMLNILALQIRAIAAAHRPSQQ
jgi:hypothetical protein